MLREKIEVLQQKLRSNLLEREQVTNLMLLAALAQEHTLLIGLPGTAKSFLCKRLKEVFDLNKDQEYLERLLTRFSVPEELFGPLSIKELEKDNYVRKIDGFLPTAKIAFLDEIFKANSAILNSLLSILNERLFDQGNQRIKTPLISLIGASNELPTTDELNALFDRFLIRFYLEYVSDDHFKDLLRYQHKYEPILAYEKISFEELNRIQDESEQLLIHDSTRKALRQIKEDLEEKKIDVSDRRWLKILHILKVASYCQGQHQILVTDLYLLPWMLWKTREEFTIVTEIIHRNIEASLNFDNDNYNAVFIAWEEQLKINEVNRNISADKIEKDIQQIKDQLEQLIHQVKSSLLELKDQISQKHLWLDQWPLDMVLLQNALNKQEKEELRIKELIEKFELQRSKIQ